MKPKSDRPIKYPRMRASARLNFSRTLVVAAFLFCCGGILAQSADSASSTTPVEVNAGPTLVKPSIRLPAEFGENGRAIAKLAATFQPAIPETESPKSIQSQFRLEQIPLVNGAELLTIFGRVDGMRVDGRPAPEVPMISVLRDTLGDDDTENDRLRYVWMLTYTQPTLLKRIAAAVPFLYQHVGNQTNTPQHPTPIIDLANVRRQTWNRFLWMGVQNLFLDTYGLPIKASTRNYRRNLADYRRAHIMQALSVLSTYENLRQRTRDESELLASRQPFNPANQGFNSAEPVIDSSSPLLSGPPPGFTTTEMLELRARLIFSGNTFGGLAGVDRFRLTVESRSTKTIDVRGHNWEMLRQRAEAEGLHFEPLAMPDGSPTHALLWIAKDDLKAQPNRNFDGRFLNIANPWDDARLHNWSGYTQVRYFDANNRVVAKNDPHVRELEMIPLAVYGLDHPKVPAVLIDFRNGLNPKKREVSRRVLHDVTKNILSLSSFGNIPYFLGRSVFDFVTGRRGLDLNQPSRLQSYSELKLLLAFNGSIDPQLQREIEHRLENVSLNPLSNDSEAEVRLARKQYEALLNYARKPDGLAARVERDRRAEMVSVAHGRAARFFFTLGNVLTFGKYVHRETATPELAARMELERRLDHHSAFLSEVAKSSPQVEVVWDMNVVRQSLQLLAEHGAAANGAAARAASKIFQRTNDDETRRLCLDALYKINNQTAKHELLRLYRDQQAGSEWRMAIADRLRKAVNEDSRMKPAEVRSVLSQVGQP